MRCSRLECWALALALSFLVLLTGWDAQAQVPAEAPATELLTLEQGLDDDLASLSTADCITACLALESMIRSAERICVLAPGPRCEAARDKVDAARRRVQERCPECAAATAQEDLRTEPAEPLVEPAAGGDEEAYSDAPAQAPPAEESAGGCAACALGARPRDDAAMWLLLALALVALRRARR